MNSHVVMGVFAIYVMVVTLLRLLFDLELPRVRVLKRVWGHTRGAVIYFVAEVLLPMALGIMYLARGLASSGF